MIADWPVFALTGDVPGRVVIGSRRNRKLKLLPAAREPFSGSPAKRPEPAHLRFPILVQETPHRRNDCGSSSLEILAKRLPVSKGPALIKVPPVVLSDSGLIEDEVGSRTACNQLELHQGIVAGRPRSLTPRLDDPLMEKHCARQNLASIWSDRRISPGDSCPCATVARRNARPPRLAAPGRSV